MWHIYLYSFIMGIAGTFITPARQAFTVDIVGGESAMGAISTNFAGMRVLGIFGGVIAGVVIKQFGVQWPFYIMTVAYLAAIIPLLRIRGVVRTFTSAQQSIRKNFVEGLKIVTKNEIVLTLMLMAVVCDIFGFSYAVVLPIFARDILKVGAVGLGMFQTMQSAGGLLAVLALASLGNYKYKGRLFLGIFLTYGVCLVLFSQSPWYLISLLLLALIGGMAATFDALEHTLLQLNVLEEQRGRAMGLWQLSIGVGPLSNLMIGAISALLGAQLALGINGTAIIVAFLIVIVFVPKLRRA